MLKAEYVIRGNDYRIEFHDEDHSYYVYKNGSDEGVLTPSVTTITNNLPPWAIPWSAKCVSLAYEEFLMEQFGHELTKDEVREFRKAPKRVRDEAGQLGTDVHSIIHDFRTEDSEGMTRFSQKPDVLRRFEHWLVWWQDLLQQGYECVESEVILYNPDYHYTGTCDAILRNPHGKLLVCDWKTGRIKDEGWLQCAAYKEAYSLMHNIDPDVWAASWQVNIMMTKTKVYMNDHEDEAEDWCEFLRRRESYYWRR